MAAEVQARFLLNIRDGAGFSYQSPIQAWTSDLTDPFGPTPGAVIIPEDGRDFFFEELTVPGLAVFTNIDPTNYVQFGLYIPSLAKFFPMGRIYPGESFPFQFDPDLFSSYLGSGSDETEGEAYFRFKANIAPVEMRIDVFEAEPEA